MPFISHTVKENISNLRMDRYAAEFLCLLSRSQIKARNLTVKINGKDVKLSRLVKQGDFLELAWDDLAPADIVPQDIPLDIVYENEDCIVINKVQGMVVHPGAGNRINTLANAVYFNMLKKNSLCLQDSAQNEKQENGQVYMRPGIVHRLDKDTSGIIIAAYNDEAHAFLSGQFKSRAVRKTYIAIVCGEPKEKNGRIETFIARDLKDRRRFAVSVRGKSAVTFYRVLKSWQTHSLILLRPKTGRTHQLRVHLKYIGCPILGDSMYGSSSKIFPKASLMLHSKNLAITLPGRTEESVFSSSVPERFIAVIKKLNKIASAGRMHG